MQVPNSKAAFNQDNFRMYFKTLFDRNNSEFIILQINYSDELKELVKKSIIEQKTEYDFYNGNDSEKRQRYLVKKWIYSSMNSNSRNSVFDFELVEDGKTEFRFANVLNLDRFMKDFKAEIKILLETQLKYSDIDCTVNFSIVK